MENRAPGVLIFLLHSLQYIIQPSERRTKLCARQGAGNETTDEAQSCPQAYGLGLLRPCSVRIMPPPPTFSGAIPCPPLQPMVLYSLLTNLQHKFPALMGQRVLRPSLTWCWALCLCWHTSKMPFFLPPSLFICHFSAQAP